MHYLLVDDDVTFSRVLASALTRRGGEVVCAANSVEALTHCASAPIERVVLDLKLEGESGLTLLKELMALQPQLRVVVLTGYSSISTAVTAVKLGAVQYLCKPASVRDIEAAFECDVAVESADVAENPPSPSRLEWEHIQRVLGANNLNISATARALGMHRRTLQRKLHKRPVAS